MGRSAGKKRSRAAFDDEPLTPGQMRELRRRSADFDDPTRYLLVSRLGPRFVLYYNVSDDVYAWKDPRGGTLFKRRKAALAVRKFLGPRIQVLRCTTTLEHGRRVPVIRRPSRSSRMRAK